MGMAVLESYVCGRWQAGTGRLFDLVNPTTGETIARAGTGGVDMAAALAHARSQGSAALRSMTFGERAAAIAAANKAIFAHRDELIEVAIRNGGNTRKDAKFDVDGATATLQAYADWGRDLGGARVLPDGEGLQLGRTPRLWGQHAWVPRRGAAVHVNAFNFPAWGLAEKAALAWLSGMAVVTKPATATSMLAERIVRIVVESRALPEGAISLLCGSAGDLLDHLDCQDVLGFTGSADTGYLLRSRERLLRQSVHVNVEADSLNSAVLGPDVEPGSDTWNLFLRDVATDMTQKAGQKCTAIRRILVPAARLADARDALSERLAAVKVGDPALPEVGMGPLSTAAQLDDVRGGTKKLLAESEIVFGHLDEPALSGAEKGKGFFFGPVLLQSKDASSATVVHQHEVFGPVATLLPFSGDAEEASALVRKGEGSLVASVFSDDQDFVRSMVLGIGAWHGRLYLGSANMAAQSPGPGTALPGVLHGGPGRAGGGEELGQWRGMALYQQRVALEGDRSLIDRLFPRSPEA